MTKNQIMQTNYFPWETVVIRISNGVFHQFYFSGNVF